MINKKNRVKIKKLPLQAWQKHFARKDQGVATPLEMKFGKQPFEKMQSEYPATGSCLLGDGYYLQGDSVWFSFGGIKYDLKNQNKGTFLSLMEQLNAMESVGSIEHVKELRRLELRVHGAISEKTQRLLSGISEFSRLRQSRLNISRHKKRITGKQKEI